MAYDPRLAFLSGACGVLGRPPFAWNGRDRPCGMPDASASGEALRLALHGMAHGVPACETERRLACVRDVRAVEERQAVTAMRVAHAGQAAAFLFATGAILLAVVLAMRGRDGLGLCAVGALSGGQVLSALWLAGNARRAQ
jgi:hypothetical protein